MKRRISLLLVMVVMLGALPSGVLAQSPSCRTFDETGHTVCDDGQARFLTAFTRWGLQNIGYPISERYQRDGFVTQAFQKAIMQWRPESGSVALANIFDDLHNAGYDETLFKTRQTPHQLPAGWDGDLDFSGVVRKRQALLDARPALRSAYFAASDPLTFFGLPTSEITDMGNHYAVRLQRAVLQEWKEDVPWAKAGQVTIANGGDIAKELGALPAEALAPGAAVSSPASGTPGAPASSPPAAGAVRKDRIVFVSDMNGANNIYTVNQDGSGLKRLTDRGGYGPRSSPDGNQIVFYSEMDGNYELYLMNADGSNLRALMPNPAADVNPSWSPDGSRIVYASTRDGKDYDLFIVNTDGTGLRRLTSTPDKHELAPQWSPDGQKILFSEEIDGNGDGQLTNVWDDVQSVCMINVDGTGRQCLVQGSLRDRFHATLPVWHPNNYGFAYAAVQYSPDGWQIWTMNIDGTGQRLLINSEDSDIPLAYSPDGSKLLFRSWRHGHWEVFIANADGSNQVLVTDNQDNNFDADWVR